MTAIVASVVAASSVGAHNWDEWECDGWSKESSWGEKGRFCEVRELTLDPTGAALRVDAGHNGGISVTGWDGSEIRVRARVQVWNRFESEARELAGKVSVGADGMTVSSEGPSDESWSVSFRISVPRHTDVDLSAHNGGIGLEDVHGTLRARTHNGGISIDAVSGDVDVKTTNGGLHVQLAGGGWEGAGLDAVTRNGGVKLSIPEDYSAELETGTRNGRIEIGFPVTVQGRIGRELKATLGSGGAPVKVVTTNGGVTIHRH